MSLLLQRAVFKLTVTIIVLVLIGLPPSFGQIPSSVQKDFSQPFCFKSKNFDEAATQEYDIVLDLYRRSFIDPSHPASLWDQSYLQSHPHVKVAINEFMTQKRGVTLRSISTLNKTPAEIHDQAIKQGFKLEVVPLQASQKHQTFWLNDGSTSRDKNHAKIVRMYIYVHKDGSILRMKPKGIPDLRGQYPRRSAHVVKAVLTDLDPNLCTDEVCNYDTSYQNEAFKVSQDNRVLPKAPSPKYGLKLPYKNSTKMGRKFNRVVKNVVMNLAHTNLITECPLLTETP